jgi:hypothetical protein
LPLQAGKVALVRVQLQVYLSIHWHQPVSNIIAHAVNLAIALAAQHRRVGILDLDVFGPSVPTLLGLAQADEPELTKGDASCPELTT